jgi:hypothetical protein
VSLGATLHDVEMLRGEIRKLCAHYDEVMEKVMEMSGVIFDRLAKQDAMILEQARLIMKLMELYGEKPN